MSGLAARSYFAGKQRSPDRGEERATTRDSPIVEAKGLAKTFDGGEIVAVDGVDVSVDPGTAVGLLGPNGAGKTTTIKMLLGLVVPTAGAVRVAGIDVHANPTGAYRRVGAMLEGARNVYWRMTVLENLRFFSALAGSAPSSNRDRHEAIMEQFGLADRAHAPVRDLSLGMKRKTSLACTLARDADVIVLDEPSLGLDVESSIELREELRRLVTDDGITVILSSHDMDVIEDVCDRVVIMNDGAIVADDTVTSLLDVLQTQTYEVHVESQIDHRTRGALQSQFDASGFERLARRERFEVAVTTGEFYDLVDVLREGGVTVTSVNSLDSSLEEAFLRATDADRRPRT